MSKQNKVLDLVLKSVWFDKIKSGEKTIEYREVKKSWASRIFETKPGEKTKPAVDKVLFSKGYNRKEQMLFEIAKLQSCLQGLKQICILTNLSMQYIWVNS